jgi:4-amino-4-deoxy-L-arabinose transferase-like glycosyltransferase
MSAQPPVVAATRPERVLLVALVLLTAWRLLALALEAPPLQFDEAQYWFWGQHLDWGYYSKPPLIAWGIAASTALFGDGMLAVRLPTLLCYPLASWLMFLAARRLFPSDPDGPHDPRLPLIVALGYATLPTVSFYSWGATTDGWLILCWALGTFAMAEIVRREGDADRWRDWLILGTAAGFGLLAKYAMGVFVASAAAYLLLHARARFTTPRPYAAALLAALIAAPNVLWNARHDFQTLRHTADISHLGGDLFHFGSLAEFAASQFAVFGPLTMAALLMVLWDRVRRRETRGDRGERVRASSRVSERDAVTPRSTGADTTNDSITLLLWLGLPMLALILGQAFLARAFANWAQAAYVPLATAVFAWLVMRRRWTLLKASFAIHLAFAALVYHHGQALRALEVEPPRALDMTARLRVWPAAGEQVARLLQARPGAVLLSDEREVLTEMAYYAREARPMLAAWNPSGEISDHFRLKYELADAAAAGATRFLVVSRKLTQAELAPRFASVTALEPVRVAIRSDKTVELRVFEAERFQGY